MNFLLWTWLDFIKKTTTFIKGQAIQFYVKSRVQFVIIREMLKYKE